MPFIQRFGKQFPLSTEFFVDLCLVGITPLSISIMLSIISFRSRRQCNSSYWERREIIDFVDQVIDNAKSISYKEVVFRLLSTFTEPTQPQ
jgi:hypothetical protein